MADVPQIEIAKLGLNTDDIKRSVSGLAKYISNAFNKVDIQKSLEIDQLKDSLKSFEIKIKDKGASATLKGLGNDFDKISDKNKAFITEQKKILAALKATGKTGSSEYKEISKSIKDAIDQTNKLDKATEDVDNQFKSFGDRVKSGGGITDLLGGLGKVGIAGGIVAGLGLATKAVFDFTQEINATKNTVRQLTGETGENLNKLTADIQAVANTFDSDLNETLLATNALAKQFGIETSEALNLIEQGFLAGADANGDFLAQLQEYPAQLKAVGLNAEDTIAILTQQVQQGVFSDKGVDTIKEAGLRLRELTPATRDALSAIGLSATEIEKSLADGTKSIFEVIQDVSAQLDTLPPQSAVVGTAIADIFGGPGEDAGLDYIKTLANVELSLDKVVEAGGEFTKTQEAQLDINKAISKIKVDIGGALAPVISEGLKFVTDTVLPIISDLSKTLIPILQQILGTVSKVVKSILQIVTPVLKLLEPIVRIIFAFVDPILQLVDVILQELQPVINDIIDIFVDLGNEIASVYEEIFKELTPILKQLVKFIVGSLLVGIKALIKIIRALMPVLKGIITVFKAVLGVLVDVVDFIVTGVIKRFNDIIDTVTEVAKAVYDFLVAPFTAAWEILEDVEQIIMDAISSVFPGLKAVIDEVSGAVNGLIDGFVGLFTASEKSTDKQPPLRKELKETGEQADKTTKQVDGTATAFSQLSVALKKVKTPSELKRVVSSIEQLKSQGKLSASEVSALNAEVKRINKSFGSGKPPIDAFSKATQDLQKSIDATSKQLALMIVNNQAGTKEFAALESQVTKNKAELKLYNDTLKEVNKNTENTVKSTDDLKKELIDLAIAGGLTDASLDNYIKNLDIEIKKTDARTKAEKDLNNALLQRLGLLDPQKGSEVTITSQQTKIDDSAVLGNQLTQILGLDKLKDAAKLTELLSDDIRRTQLKEQEKSLKAQKKQLDDALAAGEISQQEYSDKVKDIETKQADTNKQLYNSWFNVVRAGNLILANTFNSLADATQTALNKQLTALSTFLVEVDKGTGQISLNWEKAWENIDKVTGVVVANLVANLGTALAEGKNLGDAFLLTLFDTVQAAVNIISAQILASALATPESIATFGVAGFALWATLTAAINGLLAIGKASIGAQEGGHIDKGYNKPAGPRDTISMLLEPGEHVTKAKQAKKYSAMLTAINNNDTFTLQKEASKLITGSGKNETGMYVIDHTGTLQAMETNNKLLYEVSEKLNMLDKATLVKSTRQHNIKQDVKVINEIKSDNFLL